MGSFYAFPHIRASFSGYGIRFRFSPDAVHFAANTHLLPRLQKTG